MNETTSENPVRVLFVDDEEKVLNSIKRLFMDESYEILTANSGEEALELLNDHQNIGLIVSDQRMPGMQGVDLLKLASDISPDTLRIMLTGYSDIDAVIEAINKGGAFRYITKPWKDDELIQIVRDAVYRYSIIKENKRLAEIVERQNEEKIASLQEQLRQSQKMEALGRLAGGIAHDFNNLLTVIKGFSQLFRIELKENDPLRKNVEQILKATDRATVLIRQLLAFSRHQVLEMKVLDLNIVLRDLEKMLRRVIGEDIELTIHLTGDLGRVKTDQGQIEQVVINLAVNARDAMPNGGKLTIETANVDLDEVYTGSYDALTPGRYVMISVSDTGVGMTTEVKDRVFEPFFTTKENGKGTGLGLSMVYGIVKQSEGKIWVDSEPGKGTTFKVYLPWVEEVLEDLEEKVVTEELSHGNETILVVEDEERVRQVAAYFLENQGYKVLQACDGDDALLICEKHRDHIPLMLTDVVMPKMNGRVLYERLKLLYPQMKVLYMSGYTEDEIFNHEILKQEINYIQKPFALEVLAGKVRQVLDKDYRPIV